MDIVVMFSIAIVAVVLSVVVGAMLMRTQKANMELRQSDADRAAKSQELEHVKIERWPEIERSKSGKCVGVLLDMS